MEITDYTHLLYITYYWPPSGGPGVQRGLKFCKYLPEFGVKPTVLTVDEKQALYTLVDPAVNQELPKGLEVYRTDTSESKGYYKQLAEDSNSPSNGTIHQKSKKSFLDKVFQFVRGNLFIPDPHVGWNDHAVKQADQLLKSGNLKAILTSSPPHSTQLIGLKLKKQYNLPWIADLRTPWTNNHYYDQFHQTAIAKRLDAKYEQQVLQQADAILVTGEDTKRLFLNKPASLDPQKIFVIPDGYDEDDFIFKSAPPDNAFLITYTGIITEDHNIDVFLKALANLMSMHNEISYKLRFVGEVADGIKRKIEKSGVQGITEYIPYVPHQESIRYMMESTILFMSIADADTMYANVPGKLFEYLASNKPIVCLGPVHSEADHIIDECGAGRLFHYTAYDLIMDHMTQWSKAWKINPNLDLPFINHSRFSRRALTKELAEVIKSVVRNKLPH